MYKFELAAFPSVMFWFFSACVGLESQVGAIFGLATEAITPTDTPLPSLHLHTRAFDRFFACDYPGLPGFTPWSAPLAPARDRFSRGAATSPTQREARGVVHAGLGVPRVVLLRLLWAADHVPCPVHIPRARTAGGDGPSVCGA